jgi:hypothetical protein
LVVPDAMTVVPLLIVTVSPTMLAPQPVTQIVVSQPPQHFAQHHDIHPISSHR